MGAANVREHRVRMAPVLLLLDSGLLLPRQQGGGYVLREPPGKYYREIRGEHKISAGAVCRVAGERRRGVRRAWQSAEGGLGQDSVHVGAVPVYSRKTASRGKSHDSSKKHGIISVMIFNMNYFILKGFLAVGELDPLNRRLCSEKKPDVVVQVVILAEDAEIREKIAQHDIHVQTIGEVAPIEVQPAKVLSHLYTNLGKHFNCSHLERRVK